MVGAAVTHHATIVPRRRVVWPSQLRPVAWNHGLIFEMGVRDFHAHCEECGDVGPARFNYSTAREDAQRHRRETR
jgi:hypothetical protein